MFGIELLHCDIIRECTKEWFLVFSRIQIFGFSQWPNTNTEHRLHAAFVSSLCVTSNATPFLHVTLQFTYDFILFNI